LLPRGYLRDHLATRARAHSHEQIEAFFETPNLNEDETVSTKPTMSSKTLKIVLLIGSVVVVVLTIMVVAFLPRNDDASPPLAATPLSASQHTLVPHPIAGEPGLVDKLVNTPFYPLAQLVKLHPVPSIIVLVGILLTFIGVAITLGVVLSKPSGQVDVKNVVPDNDELEQVGEESFWQQNMWPWIGGGLIFFASIIVIIIMIIKGPSSLISAFTKSSKSTEIPIDLKSWVEANWETPTDEDFVGLDKSENAANYKKVIGQVAKNIRLLNQLASLKELPADYGSGGPLFPLIVFSGDGGDRYDCDVNVKSLEDAYVGLYSSAAANKKTSLYKDYVIRLTSLYGQNIYIAQSWPWAQALYSPSDYPDLSKEIDTIKKQILKYNNKK
jgi:hypothetical protein